MFGNHGSVAIKTVKAVPDALLVEGFLHRRAASEALSATTPIRIMASGITCTLEFDLRGPDAFVPDCLFQLVEFGQTGPMVLVHLDSMATHRLGRAGADLTWGDVRERLPAPDIEALRVLIEDVQHELEPWLEGEDSTAVRMLNTVLTSIIAARERRHQRQLEARRQLTGMTSRPLAVPAAQAGQSRPRGDILRSASASHVIEHFVGRDGWEHIKIEIEPLGSSRAFFVFKLYRQRDIIGLEFRNEPGSPLLELWPMADKDEFGGVFRLSIGQNGLGLPIDFWLSLPDCDRETIAQVARLLPTTIKSAQVSAPNLGPEEIQLWVLRSQVIADVVAQAEEMRQAASMLSSLLEGDEEE